MASEASLERVNDKPEEGVQRAYLLIAHFSRAVDLPGLVDGLVLLLLLVLQLSLVLDALLGERVLELLHGKALLLRRRAHGQAHAVERVVVHGEQGGGGGSRGGGGGTVCTAGGHKTVSGVMPRFCRIGV